MRIEQIYTGCLAQGAYYIVSNGEVAIIDPLREVNAYIQKANADDAKIKYIFETHFHADFVSGHVTLSEKTGAEIIYGPTANPDFKATIATDGQVFQLGNVQIKVLHTPGHTMESSTFLLIDENGNDHCIFSGDTLFLGDVGRPDLAQKAAEITQEQLAEILFDSLRNKIMTLADDVIVYPGHGAGSACGKNMSKETVGTIGEQKQINYALRADMTKAEFVKEVTDGLMAPPAYFPLNVMMNKNGYESIDEVIKRGTLALNPIEFEVAANETDAMILDVRNEKDFVKGHIPNSIFIGIDGGFAPWVGALIKDVKQEILLVAPEGREEEVITRLARVGFDHTIGYLKGSFDAWKNTGKEIAIIESISAEDFKSKLEIDHRLIFDVRKTSEFEAEHLNDGKNTPLDFLNEHLAEFPNDETFYIHCAGGYRSVIAASVLKSRGIHNLIDVAGGFGAIKKTGIQTSNFVCPSTLK
jgi:glyoxylase-like metal-dependent hydrolase (beta-lactamase superfamily II)/rhodanese-related sulfurtransferase